MIQEAPIKADQKPIDASPSSSPSSAGATPESLRCPRCDSSNTKFCYYNNYNLTQPRHFCKTCRRYWTKGGALRNVPIGGGCRKNKTASIAAAVRNSPGKLKALSSEIARTGLFDTAHHYHHHNHQHFSSNPNLLWGPPHGNNNNHFLSLLRPNQNPNPNNYSNNNSFRVSGMDLALVPGHSPSPFYRNQINHDGIQDLYPKLRSSPSSAGCYFPENTSLIGNLTSANYSPLGNSAVLDSAPVGTAGELGFWNASNLSLPTDNGVYPS